VTDQVSHPYKITGNITVLYILIFRFWIGDLKIKDSEQNGGLPILKGEVK
jgi:hypothetical protein